MLAIVLILINIFIPIGLSVIALGVFDWVFGTTYCITSNIGMLALILFILGRLKN
jgi:hypothetical protein